MASELPPGLRAALERELTGVSRRDLADRAAATSRAYRAGRGSAGVIRGRDDALAYALTRLPATFAACAAAFGEAQARAPGFVPASLLDAGCGPGGGTWAAREVWPSIASVDWLDASAPFLDLARRLAAGIFEARITRGDMATATPAAADLVLASYALAEVAPAQQVEVIDRLWDATLGLLVLAEPGTPAGYARILTARDALVARGASLLAPCAHAAPCPLAAPDWCHFAVRLPRSRDHKVTKQADAPFEDEPYAYLVAARPRVVGAPAQARILAPPRANKPGIDLKLCTPEGLERRFVPRRDKAAYATARRLSWGDAS
ncbi:small ribosomal subunit Rsm22 family protein [Phenylobacterium sp.]|uniref:small ribosomal subunit Rsm22 family protein n=1 Tax=Phenylobacterium sp. TaxID=1871053 RepID=UPI00301C92AA